MTELEKAISNTLSGFLCGTLPHFDGCGSCGYLKEDTCMQHDELAGLIIQHIKDNYILTEKK